MLNSNSARLEILEIELQTVRILANQASVAPERLAAARTREVELQNEIKAISPDFDPSSILQPHSPLDLGRFT